MVLTKNKLAVIANGIQKCINKMENVKSLTWENIKITLETAYIECCDVREYEKYNNIFKMYRQMWRCGFIDFNMFQKIAEYDYELAKKYGVK